MHGTTLFHDCNKQFCVLLLFPDNDQEHWRLTWEQEGVDNLQKDLNVYANFSSDEETSLNKLIADETNWKTIFITS